MRRRDCFILICLGPETLHTTTTHKHPQTPVNSTGSAPLAQQLCAPSPWFRRPSPRHRRSHSMSRYDTTTEPKRMDPPTTLGIMSKATSVHPHFLGEQSGHHYAIAHDGRSGYFPEDQSRNSGIFASKLSFIRISQDPPRRVDSALASVIRVEKSFPIFPCLAACFLCYDGPFWLPKTPA